ncbi:MAG: hypothetical protein KC505_08035 [Myxococcales bacterium]|nr:hypothetical protein [Myxococcales bacterium]USN51255.1 MAG: hypothetical protein H6731_02290 [Myxococcales bacterium]
MTKIIFLSFLLSISLSAVQIPWAKQGSTGDMVEADSAVKSDGPFFCFECNGELILRQGQILAAHFAHKHDANINCSGGIESWQHVRAKELLAHNLDAWKFVFTCSHCHLQKGLAHSFKAMEGFIGHIEYSYDRFFIDVMVVKNSIEIAALEVKFTHAVDDEKRQFFKSRDIPIFEVKAEQIIQAYEEGSFEALVQERWLCHKCEQKNRRPCFQCKTWQSKDLLVEIPSPPGHRYPCAFVCNTCSAQCPDCQTYTTKHHITLDGRCCLCSQQIKTWNSKVQKLIKEKNLDGLESIMSAAPKGIDIKELKEKYEEIKAEREELNAKKREHEVQLKKQREHALLEQWKLNVDQALQEKNYGHIRELLQSAPDNSEIAKEYEMLQQQLLELKPRWQKHLQERAEEIIATNRISLKVPFIDRHSVEKLGGIWYGDENYVVAAKHIKACLNWLKDGPEILPLVEPWLKQQLKKKSPQKRRTQHRPTNPLQKKQCITNFFKPSPKKE